MIVFYVQVQGLRQLWHNAGQSGALTKIAASCFPNSKQSLVQRDDLTERIGADPRFCVTVVWGENDAILALTVLSSLPAGVQVHRLPAVDHLPHLEATADVNAIIAAHLRRAAAQV